MNEGVDTPESLLVATNEDIDTIARNINRSATNQAAGIMLAFMATMRLKGFRFFLDECRRTGYDLDPNTFEADEVLQYTIRLVEYKKFREAVKAETPTKPPIFAKLKNWVTFEEALLNYLKQILGAAKTTLNYLTRRDDESPDEMDSKSKAGDALRVFCEEFGVPEHLTMDGSKEQTNKGTEFIKQIRKHNIDYHITEPERHNQNPAEGVIREIGRKWFHVMIRKRIPRKFWDYGYRWICEIPQRMHVRGHRINGCVPLEEVTGETIDISAYLDFGMYDYVWYRDNAGLGPQKLSRWLDVSHKIGSQMA